jgi:hypothetical protein
MHKNKKSRALLFSSDLRGTKQKLKGQKQQNSATKPAGLVVSKTQHDLVFFDR